MLKTLLKRKNNKKGFTLVELIIVIVILAILIGVTIGGIYKYVASARRNTDLNNASAMQSVLSTIATDKDVYEWSNDPTNKDKAIRIAWKYAHKDAKDADYEVITKDQAKAGGLGVPNDTAPTGTMGISIVHAAEGADITFASGKKLSDKINELLPDGLPVLKISGYFEIILFNDNGNPVITVKVYTIDNKEIINDDDINAGSGSNSKPKELSYTEVIEEMKSKDLTIDEEGVYHDIPWTLMSDGTLIFDGGTSTSDNDGGSRWTKENVKKVVLTKEIIASGTFCNALFKDNTNLTTIENLNKLNTSNATNMAFMFDKCTSLTSLDLSNFDTSNVTSMFGLFRDCASLTSLDLSSFDTSNTDSMSSIFRRCTSLESLNLSSFNTSKVKSFPYLFEDTPNLTNVIWPTDKTSGDTLREQYDFWRNE